MREEFERKEASAFAKFRLLMWKNLVMQWRHPAQTAAELLVPVLAMSLVLVLRSQIEPVLEPEARYPPIAAHSLNYSSMVLAGMNLSQVRIAYSPENEVLEDVVRSSVAMMLTKNIQDLFYIVTGMFPDLIANIPPELINAELAYELLKIVARVDGYNSSADLRRIYYDEEETRRVLAAIQFPDYLSDITSDSQLPQNMSYELRFPDRPRLNSFYATGGRSWRTGLLFPLFPLPGPRFPYSHEGGNDPGYVDEMFIALQHSVSMELISRLTQTDVRGLPVSLQRYPHPPYTSDLAVQALMSLFPFFMLLSFCYPAINLVRAVTLEKEMQLKEAMKIMGLPTWLHWTAWFCKQFIFLLLATSLVLVLLKVNWFTTEEGFSDYAVFTNTPWTILFFFIMLYLIGVISLCFMFSSFFSSASTAALFMGVMWFILYIPATLLALEESVAPALQGFTCLSINTAMALGFQIMLSEESTGGLQWDSLFSSPSAEESRLLFGHVVLLVAADCVIYFLIALYFEQVTPGPFGTAKPWYFVFQKSFWCSSDKYADDLNEDHDRSSSITQEQEPINHTVGVKIQNLTKKFGANLAVNNLSLKIYNDQITVLLGHNGAGKSTTISMLTGNMSPSGGSLWVAGHDIRENLRAARAQIGLCPQHNVLFNELTVREHLEFFARLKGLSGSELDAEIDRLIEKLELNEKRNAQSLALSGGQKRRLSVGIALCGGAKVVLLDEPTSGMDPASRRALWDLLQKEKDGRSMILTTHFMDEADYLGDRVAIMSGGRLQCVGSPYFLKRHYGVGYTLVIVKADHFRPQNCTELINKYIPETDIKEDRGSEVTFSLSNDYSYCFEDMLADLEKNKEEIGFTNYGLTTTTIEDVFMSVGSDVSVHTDSAESDDAATIDSASELPEKNGSVANSSEYLDGKEHTVGGAALLWQHACAMWLKLWLVWSRSWGLLLLQVLVPVLIINATLGIMQYVFTLTDNIQARPLTLEQGFTETETYLRQEGNSSLSLLAADAYSTLFNDRDRRLQLILDQTVEEYYLEQSEDAARHGKMRTQVLIGATFGDNITAWFSNFGYHDVSISLATAHSAILKAIAPQAELDVFNHPIEGNYERNDDLRIVVILLSMQFANGLGSSMGIISAVFVMFYIKERVSRAKLLQKASGIEPVVMWGSAFAFDWAWYLTICLTYLISCAAFQVTGLSSAAELGRFYLCLAVYGAAMLPFTYVISYLFGGPAYGFVVLVFANALFGMMGSQIVEALWALEIDPVPQIMDYILQFFPLYSLVTAVKTLHETSLAKWSCMQACDILIGILPNLTECNMQTMCQQNPNACCVREDPYFEWEDPGVLRYLVCLLATGALCWLLLLAVEYRVTHKLFTRRKSPPPLDESKLDDDVIDETRHVERAGDSSLRQHNLIARQLTKYYGKHLAVNQVSFSVGEMECFGLLGVNGAGKTTTFKMLMGDEMVSHGDAFVRGHSVTKNIKKVHENIGYCPQFDAVFDELTGRETLRLFALLRGLRPAAIAALTAQLAASLGFTKHLDKRVHQYSGGNKRKLSTAVALMGYGRVVFLDEPTTGVDPAAKRQVWRAVRRATAAGRSVVLTSHSMEECEALCSRLTVMVNGQFKCLGTPQHLKNKFSEGFTLTIKLKIKDDPAAVATQTVAVKDYVSVNFTNPKLMEEYQGLLTYYLPDRTAPWSRLFGLMERARRDLALEDYTISQTTLEQIFLQFTKYQVETTEL